MQRAAQREEQPRKEEEVKPDENFFPSSTIIRKWYATNLFNCLFVLIYGCFTTLVIYDPFFLSTSLMKQTVPNFNALFFGLCVFGFLCFYL